MTVTVRLSRVIRARAGPPLSRLTGAGGPPLPAGPAVWHASGPGVPVPAGPALTVTVVVTAVGPGPAPAASQPVPVNSQADSELDSEY